MYIDKHELLNIHYPLFDHLKKFMVSLLHEETSEIDTLIKARYFCKYRRRNLNIYPNIYSRESS